MTFQIRPDPSGSEQTRSASAGFPTEASEVRSLDEELPDYDEREERISTERLPMGPPLEDENARFLPAEDIADDEPPLELPLPR